MERMTSRGYSYCRCCESGELTSVLNLGSQPLPAEYGSLPNEVMETFPLELKICPACGLGQIAEYVLPERIFHNTYPYLSSASSTLRDHAKKYAVQMKQELSLDQKDMVLEIASNDGYLLREFNNLNIRVLGVEPASNVAGIARSFGIDTLGCFFGKKIAEEMQSNGVRPRLIVANNVFAHVPDMKDFMDGLSALCNEDTIVTIENPSLVTLLTQNLFDTIYHEHYSYLSAHSVRKIALGSGLTLVKVQRISTHGGSNRYWLAKRGIVDPSVALMLAEEIQQGLFSPPAWSSFAHRSQSIVTAAREWLLENERQGRVVVGYGAAHKGNTFLNSIGEASRVLKYVVDASPEKQGRYLPGSQIPVFAPKELNKANPTDILILPWNLADEIGSAVREYCPTARIWIAQPQLKQLFLGS